MLKLPASYRVCALLFLFVSVNAVAQHPAGLFDASADIGAVKHKGSLVYAAGLQQYTITGSGKNVWDTDDEFHFAHKKIKGDFLLRANGRLLNKSMQAHRKLGWMVRSSLANNAAHVSAVVHGDRLAALQYRTKTADSTRNVKAVTLPGEVSVIQLERRGNTYTMWVAREGEPFTVEQQITLDLGDEVYAGLFVCTHDADAIESTVFTNVRVIQTAPTDPLVSKKFIGSNIEILDVATANSTVIYQSPKSLQAPNWMQDGKSLIYNSDGLLYKFNLKTKASTPINSGSYTDNNNDHVISFDGKMLAISDHSKSQHESLGYVMPINGGEPKRVSPRGSAYVHGWSPDGKYLVYVGDRNGDYDVYRAPVAGGEEERLTTTKGLDDGPEYTPDGKHIWYNSVRGGGMQLWRMDADATNHTQITSDDYYNWFPHISPDGKWVVFLSFLKSEVKADEHTFYKHVYLRLMPVTGGPAKVIAYVYGGQGTINVPSWSPDSKRIAFMSYNQLQFPVFAQDK